jgi:hypothetical protein
MDRTERALLCIAIALVALLIVREFIAAPPPPRSESIHTGSLVDGAPAKRVDMFSVRDILLADPH